MKYNKILAHFLLLTLLVFAAQPSNADDIWHESGQSKLRLLTAGQEPRDEGLVYTSLLEMEFAENWYSYWRFPGDAGIALSVTPAENSGIEAADIHWPMPLRHEAYDMVSYIYEHKTAFPIDFILKDDFADNENYTGQVKVFYMVCKQVCVPEEFTLRLDVFDKDDKALSRNQAMLRLAERHIPHDGDISGLAVKFAVVSKDSLVLAVRASAGFENTDVFVDADNAVIMTAVPEIEMQEGSDTDAMIKIKAPEGVDDLNAALADKSIHIVLQNRNDVIQRDFSF
jgi:DsbC/DsbD-like thiol-disulfide interchange protein